MLKVCIAGVTCTGWSQAGKRREFSDTSERQHAIFVAERLKRAEDLVDDIVFIECASTYKADEKLRALRSSHIILILRYGPERMGWPFRRCRTFVALLNKRTMAWCGPDNFEADFSARFDRARGCDGDMLLCAPESGVLEEYVSLGAVQRNFTTEAHLKSVPNDLAMQLILPPGSYQNVLEHEARRDSLESVGGVLLLDAEHKINVGTTAGPLFPPLLTHGTIVLSRRRAHSSDPTTPGTPFRRVATPLEHFAALGFHVFEDISQFSPRGLSRQTRLFRGLSRAVAKRLSGNGMHLAASASWFFYVLSRAVPRERINRIPKPLALVGRLFCEEGDADAA